MSFFGWGKKNNKKEDAQKQLEKEHIENMKKIEEQAQREQEKKKKK